jgi:hypothetical protein
MQFAFDLLVAQGMGLALCRKAIGCSKPTVQFVSDGKLNELSVQQRGFRNFENNRGNQVKQERLRWLCGEKYKAER